MNGQSLAWKNLWRRSDFLEFLLVPRWVQMKFFNKHHCIGSWFRVSSIGCFVITRCLLFLNFADSQPSIWPGWHNLWSLSGPVLDVFWCNFNRKSSHQDAHPKTICNHRLQRAFGRICCGVASASPIHWPKGAGAIQGIPSQAEEQTAPKNRNHVFWRWAIGKMNYSSIISICIDVAYFLG